MPGNAGDDHRCDQHYEDGRVHAASMYAASMYAASMYAASMCDRPQARQSDIKVGQVPKSRGCSSEPHDLRAAWAKRRPWHGFTRVFVAHDRERSLTACGPKVERRQLQRTCGTAAVRAPDAGVIGWAKGRGGRAGPIAFWQKRSVNAVTAM
jgi:hypothetical protein